MLPTLCWAHRVENASQIKGLEWCDKLASMPQLGRGQRELVLTRIPRMTD